MKEDGKQEVAFLGKWEDYLLDQGTENCLGEGKVEKFKRNVFFQRHMRCLGGEFELLEKEKGQCEGEEQGGGDGGGARLHRRVQFT